MARYGTNRLATIQPTDVEIFYTYKADRTVAPDLTNGINTLNSATVLQPYTINGTELFGGLYSLKLPSSTFNQLGIYNIIIKPKQIRVQITDCGSLFNLPNEKGIVLNSTSAVDNNGNQVDLTTLVNDLPGYRIEYLNNDSSLKTNYFTIVTSANKCELISNNSSNSTQKSVAYRLNDSGSLLFLSVTPSTASTTKPNQRPFIGVPNQNIILTNTFFNPIMIEVELTEYTENELGIGLFGDQIIDEQNGVGTYYNPDKTILKQTLMYVVEDETGKPLYRVRENKTQIDNTQDFNTITTL
jgi:hypothetical protein